MMPGFPIEIPDLEQRTLTEEEEEMIWGGYLERYPNLNAEAYKLVFYGCYNGAYVVELEPISGRTGNNMYLSPRVIDGIYFTFINVHGPYIWYEGRLCSFLERDTYEEDLFTTEDLLDLQTYYHWHWNGLFDEELDLLWYVRFLSEEGRKFG